MFKTYSQAFLRPSHLYQSVNIICKQTKSLIKIKILTRFGTRLRINIEGFVSHRSRWKGLPKEFIVVLILLLYLFLSPQPHTKANIGFETKPKRYHRVPYNYKTIIIIYFLHTYGFQSLRSPVFECFEQFKTIIVQQPDLRNYNS